MAFEDLLLTSQSDSADHSRAVIAQGIRTYPDAHIFKKSVQGPFKGSGSTLPAVPGYRYFVHTMRCSGGNIAPENTGLVVYWAIQCDGTECYPCVASFRSAVDAVFDAYAQVDVLCDVNTAVTLAIVGDFLTYSGFVSYQLIREGDE